MPFLSFWYQPHPHSLRIALVRVVTREAPEMQILPESCGSGVKMLLLSQFFYYDGRVVTKCSKERSAVRVQGSWVIGQGAGVRGQNWGQISRFGVILTLYSIFDQFVTSVLTPDPWPPIPDSWSLTAECSSEHFGTNPIFIAQKFTLWEHLPLKLLEMQILPESVENSWWERIALMRAIFEQ